MDICSASRKKVRLQKPELCGEAQAESAQNQPMAAQEKVARSSDEAASTQDETVSAWDEVASVSRKVVPAENEAMPTQNDVVSEENRAASMQCHTDSSENEASQGTAIRPSPCPRKRTRLSREDTTHINSVYSLTGHCHLDWHRKPLCTY